MNTNAALKRIDHPFASEHLDVKISRGSEHLAQNPESQELDAAEDELLRLLAADATYVGRVTQARDRHLHFVTASQDLIEERVRAWANVHSDFGISYAFGHDPGWGFRRELVG